MSRTKKLLAAALIVLMLAAAVGSIWGLTHYWVVDFTLYAKDSQYLDLRGQEVSISHYEKLRKYFSEDQILWDIPFQGSLYSQDTKSLQVTSLTDQDVSVLDFFTQLETLEAQECKDYDQLMQVRERRPEVAVAYCVELGGNVYFPAAKTAALDSATQEDFALLEYLPALEKIVADGASTDQAQIIRAFCREKGYDFAVKAGGQIIGDGDPYVTLSGATEKDLQLLALMPKLERLHLQLPDAPAESLIDLRNSRTDVEITWTQTVAGKEFHSEDTLIDISGIEVTLLSVIEEEMKYFPDARQLEMNLCGVTNENMAQFREDHREDYKVVWTVFLGPKLSVRTDTESIMPARDGTSDFHDEEAYNLRYCEDVIAIDVGHLDVRSIEFVRYMPKLKYLVVSWTGVKDLTPLANCKELVFFEGTDAPIGDLTPLKECTALEDINVSASGAKNIEALVDLPNLKHVWVIRRGDLGWPFTESRPDVTVRASGSHTVSGWRSIPNYFAMRDALGMFYMRG